ncbi:uncharacterized protein LOC111412625 [Olea europaea var. sylvestris]|uniref:uncharacterized protein LOC111412625 n=1 Tax=Olea europaea var. sylvestris TaxID=158386 RepID=UPI000C1D0F10|nr:uncharacterized protein LOC111412625 [Olea europaea var. sylvestris]
MEEEAQGLVRDLGIPHTPDEEMSDPSLDQDWVSDRRSPPPKVSPPPLTSPPSKVSSPPLASPPSRASPPLVTSPPSGPSPSPLASPPSKHLPRVSPGHGDNLYARLTGFIAEEVGALRRDLTERVDDLAGKVDYLTGRRDETLESLWLSMEGVTPMRMGEGTTKGVTPTGGAEEVAMEGEAPTGGAEVVATEREAPMGGVEEVAPEVKRTPGVIEGKRHAVNETEQVVGKRLRVSSQYIVSPFTAEAKRRTVSRTIGQMTVSDPYKWFHDITTAGAWLTDDHIDLAMDLLRDRAQRHPKSFDVHGRVILNTEFLRAVTIEYQSFELMSNEYTVPEYMLEWTSGDKCTGQIADRSEHDDSATVRKR